MKYLQKLTIRLPLILGLASLILGLLFAFLAHYLLWINNRNLAYQNLEDKLTLLQLQEMSYPLILKKIQSLPKTENSQVFLLNSQGKLLGWQEADQPIPAELAEQVLRVFNQMRAEAVSYQTSGGKGYFLFAIPEKNSQYFLLFLLGLTSQSWRIILIFYLLAFLSASLITIISFLLAQEIQKALEALYKFIAKQDFSYYKIPTNYSEIVLLKDTVYNLLTQRYGSLAYQKDGGGMAEVSQSILQLQKILFEKPFSRLKNFEMVLYPRSPSVNTENFLATHEETNFLDIFCGHFDLNDLEANLWKHRLQEKFSTVSSNAMAANKIAETLWASMFSKVALGPGILYLRLERDALKVFRGGPFYVFTTTDALWEVDSSGETFFNSSFSAEDLKELTLPKLLLIVTQDILDVLEMDASSLTEYLNQLTITSTKELVGAIVEKLYKRQVSEVAGFILAIKRKF